MNPCETYKLSKEEGYDINCSLGLIKQRTCDTCTRNKHPPKNQKFKRTYTPTQKKAFGERMKRLHSKNRNKWLPK